MALSPYVADLNITLCSMFFLPYLFCCIHATYCSDRHLVFWVYGEGFLDPCCSKHGLGTSSAAWLGSFLEILAPRPYLFNQNLFFNKTSSQKCPHIGGTRKIVDFKPFITIVFAKQWIVIYVCVSVCVNIHKTRVFTQILKSYTNPI